MPTTETKKIIDADSQPIAWNGVRLTAPATWEIGRIGRRYLLMVAGSRPMLEIKWGKAGRGYSHKKQIRRVADMQRAALRKAMHPWQPPGTLAGALSSYSSAGFSWQDKDRSGHGFSLWCPVCHQAVLLQFHFDIFAETETARAILSSFRDHTRDDRSVWRLYDIAAVLPAGCDLSAFRLEAGRIQLGFTMGRSKLDLLRWGVARTLLEREDLATFASTRMNLPPAPQCRMKVTETAAGSRVEWRIATKRLLPWRRGARSRGRLWHIASKNRILGVCIHGGGNSDKAPFESICDDFSTI